MGCKYLLIIWFSLFAQECFGAAEERPLEALSDADLQATQGSSPYHSYRVREMFPDMHRQGDTMADKELSFIFLHGLCQHYVHELTGLDPEYNYTMFANGGKIVYKDPGDVLEREILPARYDIEKLRSLLGFKAHSLPVQSLINQAISYGGWIQATLDKLRANLVFGNLGADFQRDKVIAEKKERILEAMPAGDEKEVAFRELMAVDRRAIDRQTLLFHWIKDVFAKSLARFAELERAEVIPIIETDEFILSLTAAYRPEF